MDTGRPVSDALARLPSGPQHRPPLDAKVFHFPVEAAACEDMVLLAAVDMGLRASSGCRGVADAAVGTGKQAAPSDSIDTLTPECIEGLADLLAPYGLRVGEKQEPVRRSTGLAQRYTGT